MNTYQEALTFYSTSKIPFGSWRNWLANCYYEIEQRSKFHCSWPILLGMTVAMLEARPDTRREFRQVVASDYQRPQMRRFVAYFICMADCLAGASALAIEKNYRGDASKKYRFIIPFTINEWDSEKTSVILHRMRPQNVSLPLSSMTDKDFYITLLYGYYCCTQNEQTLQLLRNSKPILTDYVAAICNDNKIVRDTLFPNTF